MYIEYLFLLQCNTLQYSTTQFIGYITFSFTYIFMQIILIDYISLQFDKKQLFKQSLNTEDRLV